jgi:hypothetical protein
MEVFDGDGDTTCCFLEVPPLKHLESLYGKPKVEMVEAMEMFYMFLGGCARCIVLYVIGCALRFRQLS